MHLHHCRLTYLFLLFGAVASAWQLTKSRTSFIQSLCRGSCALQSSAGNDPIPSAPFGPPAVLVTGWSEAQLSILDDILYAASTSSTQSASPPVVVLAHQDKDSTLGNLLSASSLAKRDHQIPSKMFAAEFPLLLFSGFDRPTVRLVIQAIKSWDSPGTGKLPRSCFAMAVPPSMSRTLTDLCQDIFSDFRLNEIESKKMP